MAGAVVASRTGSALARQDQRGGAVDGEEGVEDRDALVRVGGPDDVEPGDRAQGAQLVDRLVGRAVLAETDRVVAEQVPHRRLGQRGDADRRAHVVGEHEERRADRNDAAVHRHPRERARHRELADAEVQLAPERVLLGLVGRALEQRPRCCP